MTIRVMMSGPGQPRPATVVEVPTVEDAREALWQVTCDLLEALGLEPPHREPDGYPASLTLDFPGGERVELWIDGLASPVREHRRRLIFRP